jgi:hypothetical protein
MIDIAAVSNAALDRLVDEREHPSGERVATLVHDFLGRFVCYPSREAHDAHTLWILHTHLMQHWDSTPRIAFLSAEPASGKSRALEVTGLLVPNPVASVNVTPAYLFRKISGEDGLPTILYDEIDTVFGPKAKDNEEIRGVLNAGHHQGATAGRCVIHGKTVTTEELPAYCAVAMAGLGWLPDTILTRSVIVRMRRRAPGESVEPFRRRIHTPQAAPIFSMADAWAKSIDEIDWPESPPEIQDRDADVWESLIAIADIIGGPWPERARVAAVALVAASKDAEPSLGIKLLTDCKVVFAHHEALSSKVLLKELIEIEESPWGDLRGKPLDERGLARRLRQYQIKSTTVRIGQDTPKGYRREDFHDAWARYVDPPPSPARSATSATSATVLSFQRDSVADVAAAKRNVSATNYPNDFNRVADVADVADLQDNGREETRTCAQCGGDDDGKLQGYSTPDGAGVHLHPECVRFYTGPLLD